MKTKVYYFRVLTESTQFLNADEEREISRNVRKKFYLAHQHNICLTSGKAKIRGNPIANMASYCLAQKPVQNNGVIDRRGLDHSGLVTSPNSLNFHCMTA